MNCGPVAKIHLDAIAANWRALDAVHAGARAGAVVKADAYGHGLEQVGAALAQSGCDVFFVAYAGEGAVLRAAAGPECRIYVLNGPVAGDLALYEEAALSGVLNTPDQVELWFRSRVKRPFALHFDTGMNRLGLRAEEAGALAGAEPAPELVMSHLACAEDEGAAMNARQLAAFRAIAALFPDTPKSLANSAGCRLGADYAFDLTRPGIALYGGGGAGRAPGMTLTAEILSVHTARAGETVGYGATQTFDIDADLATCAIGYGDGLPRALGNAGFAMVAGARCPIVGRVSMDLVTLDVSAASGLAKPGARAEFIGRDADLEEQAALAGTIGYELLAGLTARVERRYER